MMIAATQFNGADSAKARVYPAIFLSQLLGTDMVKDEPTLLAAYDDSEGITAAFNLNILHRLNRELGANFNAACFRHRALWNSIESRIEMHLESTQV
jgi:L-histidine N-alpha-methyltransferase